MDGVYDASRTISDGRYMYVRHYFPHIPEGMHLGYLWKMPAMANWEELSSKTSSVLSKRSSLATSQLKRSTTYKQIQIVWSIKPRSSHGIRTGHHAPGTQRQLPG